MQRIDQKLRRNCRRANVPGLKYSRITIRPDTGQGLVYSEDVFDKSRSVVPAAFLVSVQHSEKYLYKML